MRATKIFMLAVLVLTGCASEESDWKRVRQEATVAAYEAHMEKYPQSPNHKTAIDEIWKLTVRQNTVSGYETFLKKYGNSGHSEEAAENIWLLAAKQNAIAGYETFLKKYPGSGRAKEAVENVWRLTTEQNTIAGFEAFLANYNDSEHAKDAVEGVWLLTAKQNTIEAYEKFLKDHPKSKRTKNAKYGIRKVMKSIRPKRPECKIQSDLTVDLSWEKVAAAQSYIVYWSEEKRFRRKKARSIKLSGPISTTGLRAGAARRCSPPITVSRRSGTVTEAVFRVFARPSSYRTKAARNVKSAAANPSAIAT